MGTGLSAGSRRGGRGGRAWSVGLGVVGLALRPRRRGVVSPQDVHEGVDLVDRTAAGLRDDLQGLVGPRGAGRHDHAGGLSLYADDGQAVADDVVHLVRDALALAGDRQGPLGVALRQQELDPLGGLLAALAGPTTQQPRQGSHR